MQKIKCCKCKKTFCFADFEEARQIKNQIKESQKTRHKCQKCGNYMQIFFYKEKIFLYKCFATYIDNNSI